MPAPWPVESQITCPLPMTSQAMAATLAALRPLRTRIAQLAQNRQQILLVARGLPDNASIYGRYLRPAPGAGETDPGGAERGDALPA